MEFLAHKGLLWHVTGKTIPTRSIEWPNKPKGSTKLGKLVKKFNNHGKFGTNVNKIAQLA